jgi:hypothetical protein
MEGFFSDTFMSCNRNSNHDVILLSIEQIYTHVRVVMSFQKEITKPQKISLRKLPALLPYIDSSASVLLRYFIAKICNSRSTL